MNGTQSPDAQKASNANTNGSNSNNSSLAAKKRKKDLKPIITMEGTNQPAGPLVLWIAWHHPKISKAPLCGHCSQWLFWSLGPACLGVDRRIRPHKSWAFINLGLLDRSLGPLYLILVCPGGGAVSHLPMAPLIVPEASVG
ncbi:putative transcriptional regulatory protein C15D4.02 [Fusarium oxysporum f. sp. albedinis]|nr:putative transcriptional regulatory protein C15D4.02 [Fusarium oxysporum f. sp. albedinis]